MSGFSIKKDINVSTIAALLIAGSAFYFGTTHSVEVNTKSADENKAAIVEIRKEISGIDVIETEVRSNAKALARIEAKLDE